MRLFFRLLLSLLLVTPHIGRANDLIEMESSFPVFRYVAKLPATSKLAPPYNLVMTAPIGPQKAVISVTDYQDATPVVIKELLSDPNIKGADVLVSTDQEEVVKAAVEATAAPQDKRLLRFIPIGKLAAAKEKLASGFRQYYSNVKRTLRSDRIGLTVLAFTTGVDSFVWIHSADLSIHQKSAMVLMNLVMAATFGLDRDLWGKMNKPVKQKLFDVFDRFIPAEKVDMIKTLSSQYLSNMFLGMGVQLVRTGLLSMDHFSDVVTTSSYWLTAAKISGLVTLTSFAWSELFSSVDADAAPVAKTMLKRLAEMRGVIMAHLASVSMVLQPHVYGSTPIYSFIIHGAIGIIAMANAHHIVNWLEQNEVVKRIYKKVETFEHFINSISDKVSPTGGRMMCRSLFAE